MKTEIKQIFPSKFIVQEHEIIPGAVQFLYPEYDPKISVVGGGFGLHGDGINTFELMDFTTDKVFGYMTAEEINQYIHDKKIK